PDRLAVVRPWSDVVDRISTTLAASRDAASRPGQLAKARTLAEDAYFLEFEASDLETAGRQYLGFAPAGGARRRFYAIRSAVRDVAEKRQPPAVLSDLCHQLLLELVEVTAALNAKGVTDRSRIDAAGDSATSAREFAISGPPRDPRALLEALRR